MKKSVLFLCSQNSARSIMAEFILRQLADDRFEVYSAGFKGGSEIHPQTLYILKKAFGINGYSARSKVWTELKDRQFDFVFTLCREAREACPEWPGQPKISHWEITDPASGKTADLREIMFATVAREIRDRLKIFCKLSEMELEPYRMTYA
jgi:protein-tyrosine-phosphatase